ncbi:MAG: hypothetical protein EPO12_00260 [Aquabacterium sp.]|nr:MAG: hypothetical protein EPO12_00260 [Aquabacterium sp.]
MRRRDASAALAALLAALPLAASSQDTAPTAQVTELRPADGELAGQLQRGAAEARKRGLTAYVQFVADWCGPCKRLRASMGDPAMVDAFRGTYVMRLDADQWKQHLGDTGLRPSALPIFFALDPRGRSAGAAIDGGAWKEDIPANMAPPLKAFFTAHAWKPAS